MFFAGAATYSVVNNGDWISSAQDGTTLAGALHASDVTANGIQLAGDINTPTWSNWVTGSTAGSIVIQTSFALNGNVAIDLNNNLLAGTSFSFVSGNSGRLSFSNGRLGDPGSDLIFGVDGSSNVSFDNVNIEAGNIIISNSEEYAANVDFANSTVSLAGGQFSVDGQGTAPVSLDNTVVSGVGTLSLSNGGALEMSNGASIDVNDIVVAGSGEDSASSLGGSGSLTWSGNMTISDGAQVDLSSISTNGGATGSLALGSSGTAQNLLVTGGRVNEDTTFDPSALNLAGSLSVLNGSTAYVTDAANITGITDLVADGSGSKVKLTGKLSYTPGDRDYATPTLGISGNLSVDNGAVLALENGWHIAMQNAGQTLSVNGGGIVYVGQDLSDPTGEGVNVGIRTTISSDILDLNDGDMHIIGGGLVNIATNAVLAGSAGSVANLYLDESATATSGTGSSLIVAKDLVVGQSGTANVDLRNGGEIRAGSTVLAQNAGSVAHVLIDHLPRTENIENFYAPGNVAWYITGNGLTDIEQLRSAGDSSFTTQSGLIFIDSGVFSMGAQTGGDPGYASDTAGALGIAHFSGGQSELRLHEGTFSNQGSGAAGSTVGKIVFDSGAYFSGEGNLIAGEGIRFNSAVIAPGSRYLYDDRSQEGSHPLVIGKLDMTVNSASGYVSIAGNSVFKVAFSEDGTQASQIVVHGGDLDISTGMIVDLYRLVNNRYVIGLVDGGTITGSYSGYSADQYPQYFTLNGKELVQGSVRSDRVFVNGGNIKTTIENGNQLVLEVSSGGGNVVTKWTGANGNNWNFFDRNWEFETTFNTGQFLDGDNVTFDDTAARASINVDDKGVVLAEMNVTGSNNWTFSGGGITTYNSELYSTLTDTSGRLNKVGSGTLTFNNANQFYGGVHMGASGTTGGTIILNNERGLGTYDLSNNARGSGKGTVYVNEDSTIQTTSSVNSLQNRFIVEAGKTLDFVVANDSLTIAGDSAYGNGYKDSIGGAFHIEGTVRVDKELILSGNSAPSGGGLYLLGNGTLIANKLTVQGNISTEVVGQAQNDSGYYAGGGGIYSSATTTLGTGLVVQNNNSRGNGGGIFVDGQAGGQAGVLTLSGNTLITNNRSFAAGGGILVDGSGYNGKGTGSLVLDTSQGNITFTGNYDEVDYDDSGQDAVNTPIIINVANSNAVHLAGSATLGLNGNGFVYFYDPISGDQNAVVNVGMNAGDSVTAVFHGSSHFEGTTNVGQSTTFRLEDGVTYYDGKAVYGDESQAAAKATYGVAVTHTLADDGAGGEFYVLDDSDWQNTWTAIAQSWTLAENATLTGGGYLGATNVQISGNLNLDNAQSSGYQNTIGTVGIIGNVTVSDTSNWYLSLSTAGDPSAERTTDLVKVAGSVAFDGTDLNKKHTVRVDSMIHGQYLLMETTGGITGYNTKKRETGAEIYWGTTNLSQSGIDASSAPAQIARAQAVTYVEGNNLYLDLIARNRYVIGNQTNGVWQDNDLWEFANNAGTPTPTGGNLTTDWAKYDSGPDTNIYVNGDMVAFDPSGGNQTYTISGTVRPVDLVIMGTGNTITLNGTGSINTLSSTLQADIDSTTIVHQGSTLINDYDIPYYTGRLIKLGASTVAFANGANMFTDGIAVGDQATGAAGGTIQFSNGNQLHVGSGKVMTFYGDGTLHYASTGSNTALDTAIVVNSTKTATFNIDNGLTLTQRGLISGAGAIRKSGTGTLSLNHNNTFTGGAIFGDSVGASAGTVRIGSSNALGAVYNSATSATSGYVDVIGIATLAYTGNNLTIGNHFNVSTGGALTIATNGSPNWLNLNGANAGNSNGGAIYVDAGAASQLAVTGTGGLSFNNNRAGSGGAIYTAHTGDLNLGGGSSTAAFRFQNNHAVAGSGGAVYAAGNVNIGNGSLQLVSNQASSNGGAIYSLGNVTMNIAGITMTGNHSGGNGGAIYATGIALTNTGGNSVISGNQATGNGGALYANNGTLSITAGSTGSIQFSGNSAAEGSAAYVAGTNGSVEINTNQGNVYFYDTLASDNTSLHQFTKTGNGALMFANESGETNHSNFYGTSLINAGNFRVTQNTTFGVNSTGTSFTAAAGTYLTGGGTIASAESIINGTISADTDAGLRTEGSAEHNFLNIGTITFDGNLTLNQGSLIMVDMQANSTAPLNDYDAVGLADKIVVTGSLNQNSKADIDLYSFAFGEYLIIDAGTQVNSDTSGYTFTVHGEELTDRHVVNMYRGDDANITAAGSDDTQLWIKTVRNNLYMYWSGNNSGNWNPYDRNDLNNQNWTNENIGSGKIAEGHILNRDTAYFGDLRYDYANSSFGTPVSTSTVNISKSTDSTASQAERDGVLVTAMTVNNSQVDYVFNGGAITSDNDYEGTILTDYDPYYTPGSAPQTLVKQGSRTLTFNNAYNNFSGLFEMQGGTVNFTSSNGNNVFGGLALTNGIVNLDNAGNTFTNGIIYSGTATDAREIHFSTAAQLGSSSVTFQANGLLHPKSSVELGNIINIASPATATLLTDDGKLLSFVGASNTSGDGSLVKNGNGILQYATDASSTNAVEGDTTINAGTFRVAQGSSYGAVNGGTLSMVAGTTLSGGGAISSGNINISGTSANRITVSPDAAVLTPGAMSVPANSQATLSFASAGTVTMQNFTYKYDMGTAAASRQGTTPTGDLLNITAGTVTLTGNNILELNGPALSYGDNYLLVNSATTITSNGTTAVDPTTVFSEIRHNGAYSEPRINMNVLFGEGNNDHQLWLSVSRNTLDMTWTGTTGGAWNETSSSWTSREVNNGVHSTVFNNGDYVHFKGTNNQSISLGSDVIVSGFEVAANGNYTFTGTGGIRGKLTDATIEGRYIESGELVPDGKLIKSGTGTLTFNNGNNDFDGGIWLSGGTISIGQAGHIGDGLTTGARQGIHFTDNATLQSRGADVALDHSITITGGKLATFDTANTLRLTSSIAQDGSGAMLSKTGTGLLVLTAASTYNGGSFVNAGTLEITGNARTAGAAASNVTIAQGGTFLVGPQTGAYTLANTIRDSVAGSNRGTMAVKSGGAFAFGSSVANGTAQGASFSGTVELYDVTYNIDAITQGFFTGGSTLVTKTGSVGSIQPNPSGTAPYRPWDLTKSEVRFDGGEMIWNFGTNNNNEAIIAANNITTGTANHTTLALNLPERLDPDVTDVNTGNSLFHYQTPVTGDTLLLATSNTDISNLNTGMFDVKLYVGTELQTGTETSQILIQRNTDVADAIFDWGVFTTTNKELRMGYKLTKIEVYEGETLEVVRETGDGLNFGIELTDKTTNGSVLFKDNTSTGDGIVLGHDNTYTGKTIVGENTTLIMGVDHAVGSDAAHTSELDLTASNSQFRIGATTQIVGSLNIGQSTNTHTGTLDMGTGTLSVDNGGNVYGDNALTGAGTLNLTAGTLHVSGSNTGLTSAVNNSAASTIVLNQTAGLGNSGNIANDGTINFDGAVGDFTKTVSKAGDVNLVNQSDVYLKGDNSSYDGTFNIEADSVLTASRQNNIGTADINIAGTFVADNSDEWVLDPANVLNGDGTLRKQNTGELLISHANNGLTGQTDIEGGSIKLTADNGLGSTDVTNNAQLELAKGVTEFANDMSGNGLALVSGENIVISGDNSGFTSSAKWEVTGSAFMTNQNNMGDAAIDITGTGSHLTFNNEVAGDFDFKNKLTGDGLLTINLSDPSDVLTFNESARDPLFFRGTVQVENGTINLGNTDQEGTNSQMFEFATLQSSAGNKTNINANALIGGLTFDGGTVGFEVQIPPTNQAKGVVLAMHEGFHITSNAGNVMLNNFDVTVDPGFDNPVDISGRPILDQDNRFGDEGILLGIGQVTGSVGNLGFVDKNGQSVTDSHFADIFEGGVLAAIGTYDYGLAAGENGENLYVSYLLKVLDLKGTGDKVLTLDNSNSRDNILDARVTGFGNLAITAGGGASGEIILNNDQNDYTGETIIRNGTLVSGVDNALGSETSHTSKLTINTGAAYNLDGHTQHIGAMDNRAALVSLNNGTLVTHDTLTSTNGLIAMGSRGILEVQGGGTITGNSSITGGSLSLLHVNGSSLSIIGANTGFHGTTLIDGGGTLTLDHVYGTGNDVVEIQDAEDTLRLSIHNAANAGAGQVFQKSINGNGVFEVDAPVAGGEVYIRKVNAGFNGTARVTHGNLIVSNIAGVGSSQIDVANPDANYTWLNVNGEIKNKMYGSGTIIIDNSDVWIARDNTAAAFDLRNGAEVSMQHVTALGTANSDVYIDASSKLKLDVDQARLGHVHNNGAIEFDDPSAVPLRRAIMASGMVFKNATMTSLDGYGTILFNVDFGQRTSDFLTINDSTAGTQTVLVNAVGSLPSTSNQSIPIIETVNFISDSSAFKLPTGIDGRERIEIGSFAYTLRQGNGTELLPNTHDWYLVGDSLSKVAESVIGTAAGAGLAWHLEMDTLVKRMGELRLNHMAGYSNNRKMEGWVRTYGMQLNADAAVAGSKFTEYYWGVDGGMDRGFRIERGKYKGHLYTGAFVGGGWTDRSFNGLGSGDSDMIRMGGYATWITDHGWYLDFVGKYSHYRHRFDSISSYLDRSYGSYNQSAAGFSLEAGRQYTTEKGYFIEPQVQASYGHIWGKGYDTTGAFPLHVNVDDQDTLQLRAGVRAGRSYGFEWGSLRPYVKASVVGMWTDGGTVTTSDGMSHRADMDGARAEVGAGLIWDRRQKGQVYLDYEYINGRRMEIPWRVNVGYRIAF